MQAAARSYWESVGCTAEYGLRTAIVEIAECDRGARLTLKNLDEGLGFAISDELLTDSRVTFAGYRRPHPLINSHNFRLDVSLGSDWKAIWTNAVDRLAARVLEMTEEASGGRNWFEADGDWHATLHFDRCSPSWVNAVRRALLSEVATLAVEKCTVHANASSLCDELLIERVALMPVRTPISGGAVGDGAVHSTLRERHPEIREQKPPKRSQRTVTSDSIVFSGSGHHIATLGTAPGGRSPVALAFPVVMLRPGEEVHIEATLGRGTGRDHARFSAVSPICMETVRRYADDTGYTRMRLEMVGQLTGREAVHSVAAVLDAHLQNVRDAEVCRAADKLEP